jgi:hypothetical protein
MATPGPGPVTPSAPTPVPARDDERYAAPAAAYGASRPDTGARDVEERRGGLRRWVPLLLALLVLLGLGGFYLATQGNDQPGGATPQGTTSSSSSKPRQTTPSQTATSEPSTSTSSSSSSSTTSKPTTTTSKTQGGKSDQQLAKFVRDYYKDVTKDRDKTWDLLTPEYQRQVTRSGYDGFWSTIDSVRVEDLQADAGEGLVTTQLTYKRTDGSTATERRRLRVVEGGDGFLIAGDSAQ